MERFLFNFTGKGNTKGCTGIFVTRAGCQRPSFLQFLARSGENVCVDFTSVIYGEHVPRAVLIERKRGKKRTVVLHFPGFLFVNVCCPFLRGRLTFVDLNRVHVLRVPSRSQLCRFRSGHPWYSVETRKGNAISIQRRPCTCIIDRFCTLSSFPIQS